MSQQFENLWTQFLEGDIDDRGASSLQQLLADDPELLRLAAALYEEHRLLGLLLRPFDEEQFCNDTVRRLQGGSEEFVADVVLELRRSNAVGGRKQSAAANPRVPKSSNVRSARNFYRIVPLAMLLAVAAGIWGAVGLIGHLHDDSRSREASADVSHAAAIATLLLEEKCVWSPRGQLGEGKRLGAGRVELESGTAVLRFDSGAELVMVGPAVIDSESSASVVIAYGDVVVRATDGAEGFVVKTPTSEVVDLGTEFAVKVRRSGETEVHVLDGRVSYRKLAAEDEFAQILRAGEGVAIDQHGRQKAIPMNSPRFSEFVNRINPGSRADLLAAYEGFNYTPGALPLGQSTVGIGWDGPWRRRLPEERRNPLEDASPGELEIVHGQMNVTWHVPGGRLGMLKLPPGIVFYVRPLMNAIDLGSDDVTYISLMVREIERPVDAEKPREHLRLTFRASDDYFGDAVSFGHGPSYRPRIQAGAGSLFTSPFELPAEQTTLWIGKIVSRAQGEDEMHFRIYGENDTLGYAEPSTWHVVTRNVDSDARLDRVLLSSTGSVGRVVDELRIGPTWRSVAPISEALNDE